MPATLKLTSQEIDRLINGKLDRDRFVETFNDIPMYHPEHEREPGETHRQYEEDDGRQYRWLIFKDTDTGCQHTINYIYNKEWPNDLMDVPTSIQIVKTPEESSIYIKPVVQPVPQKTLSPQEQADRELWASYEQIKHQCRSVEPRGKIPVPKARIDEILNLLRSKNWSLIQLRALFVPVCIEYKLEDRSLWRWFQNKARR